MFRPWSLDIYRCLRRRRRASQRRRRKEGAEEEKEEDWRVTTGEEYPLPQGPFGPRCNGESNDATATNDLLAYEPQVLVVGAPEQDQVDAGTAANRSQPSMSKRRGTIYIRVREPTIKAGSCGTDYL